MKIGIITQPLETNYGGLLQNYALQHVLHNLGHTVYTINRRTFDIYTCRWYAILRWQLRRYINKIRGREYPLSRKEYQVVKQKCTNFVSNNIQTTEIFKSFKHLKSIIKSYNFEAYIVGSDQVWRPCYSENIYNDFLDFCQDEKDIKRIAYAASFGVNGWEFNEKQTMECGRLVKLFDAVSVREDSGVNLCQDYFGVNALHVLDPTLLLEKEDYIKLTEDMREPTSVGELFCYILDNNQKIDAAIQNVSSRLSLNAFEVRAQKGGYLRRRVDINDYVIPSPTKWLRAFMDAKMVFTDSFHGCVFSIIFNKPFWVIGNKERGNARFDSLLKLFELENRRITVQDIDKTNLNDVINWDRVNSIKKEWQEKSLKYLVENL